MKRFIWAIVFALVFAATIFVAQNTEMVSVRFLVWELSMSRVLLLLGAMGGGFVVGFITSSLLRRKSRATLPKRIVTE